MQVTITDVEQIVYNGRVFTRQDVYELQSKFKPLKSKEVKDLILVMASRPEGVIQEELAAEIGMFEKNRLTGYFRHLEKKKGKIFVEGKRVSERTGAEGQIYFTTKESM